MNYINKYLIEAIKNWIDDNNGTTYININVYSEKVIVPKEAVTNGKTTLNINEDFVSDYVITDQYMSFKTILDEEIVDIFLPLDSINSVVFVEKRMIIPLPEMNGFELTQTNHKKELLDNKKPNLVLIKNDNFIEK